MSLPRGAGAFARGFVLVGLSAWYVAYVFGVLGASFWTNGLGDWGDSCFINALLEHWYRSATTLSNPASPPMYYPVAGTLGYSHGLVLYAPFYALVRPFCHPFLAYNLALAAVVWVGIVCTHAVLRRHVGVSFVEALALTAFFVTSKNVVNEGTAVWSQRASVFLIPPILLMLCESARSPASRLRLWLAVAGGFAAGLLVVQDSYTGQFTLLFAGCAALAAFSGLGSKSVVDRAKALWRGDPRPITRAALLAAVVAGAWACWLRLTGGVEWQLLGVRIASREWRRPAAVAAGAFAVFATRRGAIRRVLAFVRTRPWGQGAALGAALGFLVFLAIYLDSFLSHGGFAKADLRNALVPLQPSTWHSVGEMLRAINVYETARPFVLVLVVALLAWVPGSRRDKPMRHAAVWLVAVSCVVLAVPLRVGSWSTWMGLAAMLPGFSAIRDPRRIIYVYELAVVLAAAAFLTRARPRWSTRAAVVALLCVLMAADWNGSTFRFTRANAAYDRWIAAPIDVDPSCRSFVVAPASDDYESRSQHAWALYGVDALFVALRVGRPTLNGYSAWAPDGWDLAVPRAPGYQASVAEWSAREGLSGVCWLDMDGRTMRPAAPPGAVGGSVR